MVTWYPLTKTLDTLEATDCLSGTLMPFDELKRETRRYVCGERTPHYPMPAINKNDQLTATLCLFCGSINDKCLRLPQPCLEYLMPGAIPI